MRVPWSLVGVSAGALLIGAAWATVVRRPEPLVLGPLPAVVLPHVELAGGATTVTDTGRNAFGRAPMNMPRSRWPEFYAGKGIFDRDWSDPRQHAAVAGPFFSATGCMTCHVKDGRGQPPASPSEAPVSLAFQLSAPGGQGLHPLYGMQLDAHAVEGQVPEGHVQVDFEETRGTFATGEPYSLVRPRYQFQGLVHGPLGDGALFSARVSPVNFGLGLLEALPEAAILARADPEDADHDGISGRANQVLDVETGRTRLGRFGWKANQPTLRQQVAHALVADMGVTTTLYPREQGRDAPGEPEVSQDDMDLLMIYMRLLAVPKRRDWEAPEVQRGHAVFRAVGCAACHVDTPQETGMVEGFDEVSRQVIYPYTDLLLHDLGEGLADGRPDGLATGSEWRTPPLWGIGLVEAVNQHTRFLHDGRARSLEEAVLWHGGEAAPAQARYVRLPREDRAALLAFLKSL
ncbi:MULTISPECIES: di-heme oxidoredictase family protein [Corallococcus]|uniref:di-heme oxidoreductase family protein n=1 Tax=Corallococcus TaxID=83461 RepID=UPI00117C541B|nr:MULTISPECIES: di-heme oxidoredictase family protein [Corallococcus]NBD14518.1 c-type cytochrome [Corallococcus silvisoli]TSC19852.1 c-type cytochrome [Corallococcus sp. Z5C101001]